mgnify:CR=1 FL=1
MRHSILRSTALLAFCASAQAQAVDWSKANPELLRHYQALIRIDTTDPPGDESHAVEYLQKVVEAERMPVIVTAKDPARPTHHSRLKGNG